MNTPMPAKSAAPRKPVTQAAALKKPLPQNVVLPMPTHLRADRPAKTKDGKTIRRVVVEFLDGKSGLAMSNVRAAMKAAGFKSSPSVSKSPGVRYAAFRKDGGEPVRVWVKSFADQPLVHASATGTIRFDWPL